MTKFLKRLYVGTKEKMNNLIENEKGSTAVEFMGIAAVAVIVIFVVTNFLGTGGGKGALEGLLSSVINGVMGIFKWF